MLLTTIATAPICQLSPFRKNSRQAKTAPAQANPAMCSFLRAERSTKAPTIGSTKALVMVAKLVR